MCASLVLLSHAHYSDTVLCFVKVQGDSHGPRGKIDIASQVNSGKRLTLESILGIVLSPIPSSPKHKIKNQRQGGYYLEKTT